MPSVLSLDGTEDSGLELAAMGLFGRKQGQGGQINVSADIVPAMTEYGQQRLRDTDAPGPFHEELESLAADDQKAWVEALSQAIIPIGGVAAYGASTLVMLCLNNPVELDAYCRLLDTALDYLRESGVPEMELTIYERSYWLRQHPDEAWLQPVTSRPTESSLTPLAVGQERKISVLDASPDSKAIYVLHLTEGKYVWALDMPSEDGSQRIREERGHASKLSEVYAALGENLPPSHWTDPEFAQFLPFPYSPPH
jgi:hypothetical protein